MRDRVKALLPLIGLLFGVAAGLFAQTETQVNLAFPIGGTNTTTASEASLPVNVSAYNKITFYIGYDAGVIGTVFFDCAKTEAGPWDDSSTPCGGPLGTAIPFPDHSELQDSFVLPDPQGWVRVRFVGLQNTDSTHKVRASALGSK